MKKKSKIFTGLYIIYILTAISCIMSFRNPSLLNLSIVIILSIVMAITGVIGLRKLGEIQ